MDWTPWLLLAAGTVISIVGFFFSRTMNTLSKHTITLTQLVEKLRPLDKIVNEIIEIKLKQAVLEVQVNDNTEKIAQTVR